jgi:dolichyl-diphosphooligosaccharide---protein glycosyltransferase
MTEDKSKSVKLTYSTIVAVIALATGIPIILSNAIQIRMLAIQDFGPVIHEFDPYFNFRATEYLYEHGRAKFFKWFDYMSWYPLGRPVGTTIYPGMQFTAVWIKNHIVGDAMSLNDVCCYIPVLFGVLATFLVGFIAYESSLVQNTSEDVVNVLYKAITGKTLVTMNKSDENSFSVPMLSAIFAMFGMSIIPAHLMRSVGGGFDNECVAITAMLLTFYFWVRSLRAEEDYSYLFGILAAVAYFYVSYHWL